MTASLLDGLEEERRARPFEAPFVSQGMKGERPVPLRIFQASWLEIRGDLSDNKTYA